MPTPEPTRAVYVRMPSRIAEKLDRVSARLGVSKRDLLSMLVTDHLDIDGDNLVLKPGGRGKSRPAQPGADPAGEVLSLADAAQLLKVDERDVESLAESGAIPCRRVGDHWRFSRTALLMWLDT